MKVIILLILLVITGMMLPAQNQGPIFQINTQITNYFNYYPREKVFLVTDKLNYRPGESIWFRTFFANAENHPVPDDGSKLTVGLYSRAGVLLLKDVFSLNKGIASGNLIIPDNLTKDIFFLGAYVSTMYSPDQISVTKLKIDPQYSNQWVIETMAKDSISTAGKTNELTVVVRDLSGNPQKNEFLRYYLKNGAEIIESGKIKTDDSGKIIISFNIPVKTNGEPFVCKLTDSRDEWQQEVFLPTNIDPVVIKFYPEGGNLVAGVPSRIGFTALNKWGIPVDVEGSVLSADGNVVASVKTLSKGLGIVMLTNLGQQKLKLVLSGKSGQNQSFDLPAPVANGLATTVVKTDADFIYTNLVFTDKQKHPISLIITHGNAVYWSADMEIDGSGRLKIPANGLPHGINLLSIFSKDGNLLSERLLFRENKQDFKIKIEPEQQRLQAKGEILVKAQLIDENNKPVSANVSISVSDRFVNGLNRMTIGDYMQIETEVENPISLFPEVHNAIGNNTALLDIFLIANHLIGFDWAKIRQFKPENAAGTHFEYFRVSGVVTDKNGNKINKAKVSLANNKNMQIYSTTTNVDGIFSFPNLNMNNIDDFVVKATDSEGKRSLKVDLIKDVAGQISVYIADKSMKFALLDKDERIDRTYVENNPTLFVKAPKKAFRTNSSNIDLQRKQLSSATSILDVIKSMKPYKLMSNQIVFFGSENSLTHQGGALIVVDGQQMGTDVSAIQGISPAEVDHINVSTSPVDIQRYTGLNSVGLVEIFLKGGMARGKMNMKTEEAEDDYRIPGSFPETKEKINRNTGTTLFWRPELKVDQSGKFEFRLGAGKVISDFVIEIQGTTPDGRFGVGEAKFSVTK